MKRGFSLLSLLLAMALGSSCLLLALQRFEQIRREGLALQRAVARHFALRLTLFLLARDVRQQGQSGCQPIPSATPPSTGQLRLDYGATGWPIVDYQTDAQSRLVSLTLAASGAPPPDGDWYLTSCSRFDHLRPQDYQWHDMKTQVRLQISAALRPLLGGPQGHHLASLELAPRVTHAYHFRDGQLWRDGVALLPLQAFEAVPPGADGLWRITLTEPDGTQWPLTIAARQQGMVLLSVLVLMLAGVWLLDSAQRLALDDSRQGQQQVQWLQAHFRAEYALRRAEDQVQRLSRLRGHGDWFRPGCRQADAPEGWRQGLCSPAVPGSGQTPAWLRDGDGVLAPCGLRVCVLVPLPQVSAHRMPKHCDADARKAPIQPSPCFIVELLDQQFRGAGLYRITVRAWGHTRRSSVTLQSLYASAGDGMRLSWRALW